MARPPSSTPSCWRSSSSCASPPSPRLAPTPTARSPRSAPRSMSRRDAPSAQTLVYQSDTDEREVASATSLRSCATGATRPRTGREAGGLVIGGDELAGSDREHADGEEQRSQHG